MTLHKLKVYKTNLVRFLKDGKIEIVIEDTINRGRRKENGFHREELEMSDAKKERIRYELARVENEILSLEITSLQNRRNNLSYKDF